MQNIPHLEMHVIHSCNLSCESCSHYSNQGHKGMVSLAEAEAWIKSWSPRLTPNKFSLLGGEPTVHPDLAEFLPLVRKHWPTAHLRLVTNGFFLHRHPDLPLALQRDPDSCIYLSIHHDSAEYLEKLRPILDLLKTWMRQYGIRVKRYDSFKYWTRRYHGERTTMKPFSDAQPRISWKNCSAKNFPQLLEGKIWKCAPLAYLKMQAIKYQLGDDWNPYLQYPALAASCSDDELAEFLRREEEPFCGMCPAYPERFTLPLPLQPSTPRSLGKSTTDELFNA